MIFLYNGLEDFYIAYIALPMAHFIAKFTLDFLSSFEVCLKYIGIFLN